jgi:hypothetical protein
MSWDDMPPIPERKRRVVLNIPRDLHMDLRDMWCEYKATGMASSKERFPEWLLRWIKAWIKRDELRLKRRRMRYNRMRDEALEEDARREAERE